MDEPMRILIVCLLAVSCLTPSLAHHPNRELWPVHQRFELIGPIGNKLPMSYRRRYNRPTNLGGKIAYHIAPTSQEAMRWHKATHHGHYKNHAPRMVAHYFYPKPWESLRIGPRPRREAESEQSDRVEMLPDAPGEPELMLPEEDGELLAPATEAIESATEAIEPVTEAIEPVTEAIEPVTEAIDLAP
jgi:hypothetical protein